MTHAPSIFHIPFLPPLPTMPYPNFGHEQHGGCMFLDHHLHLLVYQSECTKWNHITCTSHFVMEILTPPLEEYSTSSSRAGTCSV